MIWLTRLLRHPEDELRRQQSLEEAERTLKLAEKVTAKAKEVERKVASR